MENRMLMLCVFVVIAGLGMVSPAEPQDALAFEVASVKPSAPEALSSGVKLAPGGRFTAANVSLRVVVMRAFDLKEFQVVGQPAALNERYSIEARAPEGVFTDAQIWEMVRTLLAVRFDMKSHRTTKQMPVLELIVGRKGARIQPAEGEAPPRKPPLFIGPGSITATHAPMAAFAVGLSRVLDRPVIDATGLAGVYDFDLHYDPKSARMPSFLIPQDRVPEMASFEASISTAIEEQLGLRLVPVKRPVEVLVIDSINRPSGN